MYQYINEEHSFHEHENVNARTSTNRICFTGEVELIHTKRGNDSR